MRKYKRLLFALFCIFGPYLLLYLCTGFLFWAWDISEWIIFKKETLHSESSFLSRLALLVILPFLGWVGYIMWDEYNYKFRNN